VLRPERRPRPRRKRPGDDREDRDEPTPDRLRRRRRAAELPEAVAKYYEVRSGYANYWFNRYHQQRVWNAFLARGDFADAGWEWTILAKNEAGADVEMRLAEERGSIIMPAGRSEAEFSLSLGESLSPPRSGGLLATLHLWQRLLLVGPRQFGEVYYFGTLPWPDERRQPDWPDCLVGIQGGVETRFYFDPVEGDLVGIEMQVADDFDPCEIYFDDFRPVDGRRLPHHWIIRHGDEVFAELAIVEYRLSVAAAAEPEN